MKSGNEELQGAVEAPIGKEKEGQVRSPQDHEGFDDNKIDGLYSQ